MVTNHFTSELTQQSDSTKPWLCWWCLKKPEVRERYGIAITSRGTCSTCGILWELVGVGGHVPVSESSWVCGTCFRAKTATTNPRDGYAASVPGQGITCTGCGDSDLLIAYPPQSGITDGYTCNVCYGKARSAAFIRNRQDGMAEVQLEADAPILTTTVDLQVPAPAKKLRECALKSKCCRAVRRCGHPVAGRGLYCSDVCRGRARALAKQKAASNSDRQGMASQTRVNSGEEGASQQAPSRLILGYLELQDVVTPAARPPVSRAG